MIAFLCFMQVNCIHFLNEFIEILIFSHYIYRYIMCFKILIDIKSYESNSSREHITKL